MLNIIPFEKLGQANHGWLHARHHFSFSSYYDANRMGFGVLRVINDDIIQAGTGFPTHPHSNMEIITYVRQGAITHRDSEGNVGRTEAGDVQVMSAGTGIRHSEHNLESEDTNLYQIWIEPNRVNVKPRWDAREFPKEPVTDQLTLLVSGDGTAPLHINQDATIHAGRLLSGSSLVHRLKQQAYLLVADGEIEVNGEKAVEGDGVEITDLKEVSIAARKDSEVLVIEVPAKNELVN